MRIYQDPEGDGTSVWLVNKNGDLVRIRTPFKVICIVPVRDIKANTQVYVDRVLGSERGELIFMIFKKAYLHSHFLIILKY